MKHLTASIMMLLPVFAAAHDTGAPHLHAEHGMGWLVGAALISLATGLAARQAIQRRRK
jgi:hypothetical protein